MKITIVKSLSAAVLALSVAGGLTGCAVHPHRVYPPSQAHVYAWYPYDYFYYPSVGVYFHIHSGYYWYQDRGRWHRSHQLPPHLVLLPRDRVRIKVDSGEPWRHHQEHVQRYRPRLAPQDYQRPDAREGGRQERERNQQLYRENRDRRQPLDRQGSQAPQVPQERRVHEEPRTRQGPQVHQERTPRQAPQVLQEPKIRQGREVRQEHEIHQESRGRKERQAHQDPVDSQDSGENHQSQKPEGRMERRDRYFDGR